MRLEDDSKPSKYMNIGRGKCRLLLKSKVLVLIYHLRPYYSIFIIALRSRFTPILNETLDKLTLIEHPKGSC